MQSNNASSNGIIRGDLYKVETEGLREKIQNRLDQIEMLMHKDFHLKNPEEVMLQTLNVSKFWSILSEEDRDFIQGVQSSIEEGWSWKE